MWSRLGSTISAKNGAIQSFYQKYKTAFTVATTLIGTSAAWASYFARTKHNQRLEKDIKEINQSIADIPKKTNKMYDRMDMIILGSSALVVGYLSCAIKHKTVNYYRFWNARRVAAKTAKQKLQSPDLAVTSGLVSKEEIKTLEKNENHLIRYYFASCKQNICSMGSSALNWVGSLLEKTGRMIKSAVTSNKKLVHAVQSTWTRVSSVTKRLTHAVSSKYDALVYKYNLHVIEKRHVKAVQNKKESVNNGNMSSVIK
ncbi:hypothetical protein WA538_003978 [Blastocystis sp. DL]